VISDSRDPPHRDTTTEGAAVACLEAATFAHPEAMCITCFNARRSPTSSKTDIHAQHEILIFLYFKETEKRRRKIPTTEFTVDTTTGNDNTSGRK
jgi:hypothetical protein